MRSLDTSRGEREVVHENSELGLRDRVTLLEARLQAHVERERDLVQEQNALRNEQTKQKLLLTRWHGIFLAIVGLGAFIGWILAQLASMMRLKSG